MKNKELVRVLCGTASFFAIVYSCWYGVAAAGGMLEGI
jgi:hypothetical protein